VSQGFADPVDRAQEELAAARELLASGFPSQALARAYHAGLQVAVAALGAVGETPATEAGVIAAFGRRVVGDNGVDHEVGRTLRKLFEDRNDVDYALLEANEDEARKALDAAELLVDAAAKWVAERRPAGRGGGPS
jgi:uncharacterized protein (UPF0332 family)